jgi:hypothetical protein
MEKKHLEGSKAKDAFLYWHKNRLPSSFYAVDADLCLIRRSPFTVVAVIDFKAKNKGDKLTFSHIVLYNWFLKMGVPVFIVEALWNEQKGKICKFSKIDIYQYMGGDPKPDDTPSKLQVILSNGDERAYFEWEKSVREAYKPRDESGDLLLLLNEIIEMTFNVQRATVSSKTEDEALTYLSGSIGAIIVKLYNLRVQLK